MNNESIDNLLETEKRLKKVKLHLKMSQYLGRIEDTDNFHLIFNEHRCNLNLVVKDHYNTLIGALKGLRDDSIYLEFNTCWESDGTYIFTYGKDKNALQIWFFCDADKVPEQLVKYKRN